LTPSFRPHPLEALLRARVERWLDDGVALHAGSLTDRELRTGVQALSGLYVEGRARGRLAARSLSGAAKRAAFATYYAALHFLTIRAVIQCLHDDPRFGSTWPGAVRRVLDLGCGTGAAGAAAALETARDGVAPLVLGVDVSGWALSDARRTWKAFGLRGRALRKALPAGAGRPADAGLAVAGWSVNELDDDARNTLLAWARDHVSRGGALLVVEPLAGSAVPWWSEWRDLLETVGCVDGSVKADAPRLEFVERLDRASGLDHSRLGARWLAGPVREPATGPPGGEPTSRLPGGGRGDAC
jgi:SAM-dependent methyltransferase